MPQRPKGPNYYQSRHAYFSQVNRQQIRLAGPICESCEKLEAQGKEPRCKPCKEIKEDAWKAYHARMAVAATDTAGDDNTVNAVLEARLQWTRANAAPSTHRTAQMFLRSSARQHGRLRVRDLEKYHVEQWLNEMQQERRRPKDGRVCRWNGSTRRLAQQVLSRAFNWAVEQGIIGKNPVPRMKKPPMVSRGAQAVINDRQHQILLHPASRRSQKGFYNLLVALYETGARPGELCGLEARHYNQAKKVWIIEAGEVERKRGQNKLAAHGRRRIILLTKRGRLRTFSAAACLVADFGLTPEEALPILRLWNLKSEPRWTVRELREKLEDADRTLPDEDRGWRVMPPRPSSVVVSVRPEDPVTYVGVATAGQASHVSMPTMRAGWRKWLCGRELVPELKVVDWRGMKVFLAPPGTVTTNKRESWSCYFLGQLLRQHGAEVEGLIVLPPKDGGP